MEFIGDRKFFNCIGELVPATKAFKNKKLILLYFSASWCEPCKKLLPILKKFYNDCAKKAKFQMIYISADDDPDTMIKHFIEKHSCSWYALPVGDPCNLYISAPQNKQVSIINDNFRELQIIYGVTHLPTLIVVRISDGLIVSTTGWEDILELGADAIIRWKIDDDYM